MTSAEALSYCAHACVGRVLPSYGGTRCVPHTLALDENTAPVLLQCTVSKGSPPAWHVLLFFLDAVGMLLPQALHQERGFRTDFPTNGPASVLWAIIALDAQPVVSTQSSSA